MQYQIKQNYIENINIFKMPFVNFYDNGSTLRIVPSLSPDKQAAVSYKNDIADIDKIRFSKRLRYIYDIRNTVSLTEKDGAYETKIKHSLHDYHTINVLPAKVKEEQTEPAGTVLLNELFYFTFPEKIYGTYKVSIYTKERKCIKLEPVIQTKCYSVFTSKELYAEYGIDLAWYPYDEVSFICETTSDIRLNAAMLQKLNWSVKHSKLRLYRGASVNGRYIYYIGEELEDFLTNKPLNSYTDQVTIGYISENTASQKERIKDTIQLLKQTDIMTSDIKEMKKEHEKLIQEQRKAIERMKKNGPKI